MKNKRVWASILAIMLAVSILASTSAFAAKTPLAISAGKNFGEGVNTTQDATDASNAYKRAGYTVKTFTNPIKSNFNATNLRADILFFSGHANPNLISFGTLKFTCQSGTTNSDYINLWNTAANQKLITFAGCNTAGENDKNGSSGSDESNITMRAVERGADAAVGWTTTVSAGSHTNWLKRYNDALADGKTVSEAIDKANSYIYLPGSGVKNVKYYGNGDLTIATSSRRSNDEHLFAQSIIGVNSNMRELAKFARLAVTQSNQFETNDYVGYVYPNDDGYLMDIYFKSNGVITNAAITMRIDFVGNISQVISHNLPSNDIAQVRTILNRESVAHVSVAEMERVSNLQQNTALTCEKVADQSQFEYYDITTKTTYLVTYTYIVDENDAIYVKESVTPIR